VVRKWTVVIYHPKKAEANPAKTPNAPVVTVRVVSHPKPPKRPSNVVLHDTVVLHVRAASRFFHLKKLDAPARFFLPEKMDAPARFFHLKKLKSFY
jgi:hypothetical protein